MDRTDKLLVTGAAAIATATAALVIWPPKGWERGDAAGVAQAVAAIIAVAVALLIATQDRRRADRDAAESAKEERQAFARRRDYDECVRLLQVIEEDRRRRGARSAEGTALILAMWPKRNWMGRAVDFYVEATRDPNNRYARADPCDDEFQLMQQEVVAAIDSLDHADRA
ncbi:hypothetical protein QQY66_23335 [Streptomyces sp. DG2A-72]|uniref:hypothetical protein n=1 Tax=Streptomyces sp. DG2A-72 TaxID=3051386 RepID=UPI00265C02C8|nr:hypothetical protein [Streptomyces sp. DG2A-72]MDO0934466.1 hypothetical protein [Streptomyces sp. DG2A-72]